MLNSNIHMYKLKRKIYETMEDGLSESLAAKIFEVFIVGMIICNVVAIIIGSGVENNPKMVNLNEALDGFEVFSVIVFSVEYLLRIWTADLKYPGFGKIKAISKFIFSPSGIIDLLAVMPFYVKIYVPNSLDGRILRAIRLLRLLRILKLTRFVDSFKLISNVIKNRKYELLITFFIAAMFVVIASCIMFELENEAQPDKFPNILSAFWWSIATLTTIGYGDVYPITALGKCMSTIISIIGIGLIALPTGIISSGFLEEYRNSKQKAADIEKKVADEDVCPHCGNALSRH